MAAGIGLLDEYLGSGGRSGRFQFRHQVAAAWPDQHTDPVGRRQQRLKQRQAAARWLVEVQGAGALPVRRVQPLCQFAEGGARDQGDQQRGVAGRSHHACTGPGADGDVESAALYQDAVAYTAFDAEVGPARLQARADVFGDAPVQRGLVAEQDADVRGVQRPRREQQ